MNTDKKQIEEQFLPRHTHYIRSVSERTGRSYRELEAEWKKAERQFDFDRMRDPLKYANLKRTDGTVAQEISRRFEESVVMPEQEAEEQIEDIETDIAQDDMAEDMEENLEIEPEVDIDIDDLIEADIEEPTPDADEEVVDEDISIEEDMGEGEEGIPNKSLERQRKLERPSDETATTPGEVNEQDS